MFTFFTCKCLVRLCNEFGFWGILLGLIVVFLIPVSIILDIILWWYELIVYVIRSYDNANIETFIDFCEDLFW